MSIVCAREEKHFSDPGPHDIVHQECLKLSKSLSNEEKKSFKVIKSVKKSELFEETGNLVEFSNIVPIKRVS